MKAVEAIKQVGYTADDTQGAVHKLIKADMSLANAEGLANVAKDAEQLSTEGETAAQALEKIMLAIESGRAADFGKLASSSISTRRRSALRSWPGCMARSSTRTRSRRSGAV